MIGIVLCTSTSSSEVLIRWAKVPHAVAAGLTKILIKKLIASFKIVTYFVSGLPFNKTLNLVLIQPCKAGIIVPIL